MKSIHKFILHGTGKTTFTTYATSKILSCGCQKGDELVVWVEVNMGIRGLQAFHVSVYGTGWELPENPGRFIGTVQDKFDYVWHVYEEV